jgi:hypothetical protein
MRRDQLEHAIRAACQITGQLEVIVVGSQAILGTYPEYELPSLATRSLEIDILPITDDNNGPYNLPTSSSASLANSPFSSNNTDSASTVLI